ncbi:MAG: VIT1/CCC1 transporter family protein [Candidatus Omnitrophica bacterium]|nr:VIT1/CCC1 transporter family protein [Candidatus Omnitrophota bacterium]
MQAIEKKFEHSHEEDAIIRRLQSGVSHSYLKDFIYGAIDGAVTTFAVVSGVAGAGLSTSIVIIMGVANLIADGFSMAVSNYLGTRAEGQTHQKLREIEEHHVDTIPEGEREEVRQIFRMKGFEGDTLEKIVEVITSDKDRWVDVMLAEEYGISFNQPSPTKAALATFSAFVLVGMVPLVAFLYQWISGHSGFDPFLLSAVMTGVAFFMVGAAKGRFLHQRWFVAGLETLLVGGAASALAYGIGLLLHSLT